MISASSSSKRTSLTHLMNRALDKPAQQLQITGSFEVAPEETRERSWPVVCGLPKRINSSDRNLA
jgi:hypothetical protein